MKTLTVEQFLQRYRKKQMSISDSVKMWLRRDDRLKKQGLSLDEPDQRASATAPGQKRNDRFEKIRRIKAKIDHELELDSKGMAPDGKPWERPKCSVPECIRAASSGAMCIQHSERLALASRFFNQPQGTA